MTYKPTIKTMKKPLILVLLLFICAFINAQEFTLGLKGGLNHYTIGDINSRGGSLPIKPPDELFTHNKDIGTQFGVYVNVEFGKLFIRPELNFVSSKNNYEFPNKTSIWKTSKIDIPILIGYEIFDPITIYAGPGFNIFNDTTLDGVQVTSFSDGGPDLEKTTININFGVMLRFGRYGIDLRYEYGLGETKEELLDIIRSEYGVNLADLRAYQPNVLSLSLTIDVLRTADDNLGWFFSNLFRSNTCNCLKN